MEININREFINELNEFLESREKVNQNYGELNCQIFCLQKSLEMKQELLEQKCGEADDLRQRISFLEGKTKAQENIIKCFSGYYNADFYQRCPTCGRPVATQFQKENRP